MDRKEQADSPPAVSRANQRRRDLEGISWESRGPGNAAISQ
jgi:hypothetical protein